MSYHDRPIINLEYKIIRVGCDVTNKKGLDRKKRVPQTKGLQESP